MPSISIASIEISVGRDHLKSALPSLLKLNLYQIILREVIIIKYPLIVCYLGLKKNARVAQLVRAAAL